MVEDIIPAKVVATCYHTRSGFCRKCNKRVGRHSGTGARLRRRHSGRHSGTSALSDVRAEQLFGGKKERLVGKHARGTPLLTADDLSCSGASPLRARPVARRKSGGGRVSAIAAYRLRNRSRPRQAAFARRLDPYQLHSHNSKFVM